MPRRKNFRSGPSSKLEDKEGQNWRNFLSECIDYWKFQLLIPGAGLEFRWKMSQSHHMLRCRSRTFFFFFVFFSPAGPGSTVALMLDFFHLAIVASVCSLFLSSSLLLPMKNYSVDAGDCCFHSQFHMSILKGSKLLACT